MLKYYSYETHLITDVTIKRLLEQLTKIPGSSITQEVVEWIKDEFENQSNELYYFSLEALKRNLIIHIKQMLHMVWMVVQ